MTDDMHKYDDIIDLPHHVSRNHRPMPAGDRAAQFMPFAALNGYEEATAETARRTETKPVLDDSEIEEIDAVLRTLHRADQIYLRYFVRDEIKEGGMIRESQETVKKISAADQVLETEQAAVRFEDILNIERVDDDGKTEI